MSLLVASAGSGAARRLILAGASRWGLWLLAGGLALALILLLYRYERRLVSRRAGAALLGLRVLAALALIAALFEPIAARTYRETVRGRVVLGVDLSESMATEDAASPGTSPGEAKRPVSRREAARQILSGDLLPAIASAHDVESIGFARDSSDGAAKALADLLKASTRPDDPAALATDWTPVLERGLKDADRPVVGVVLLTDGQRNLGPPADALADKLAARGVPVYPVLIGSIKRPIDAAVAAIKAPERVSKGDAADVLVTVKIDGPPPGTEVPVTLDRPGASPMKKTVRVPADGSRPVVGFRIPMDAPGVQTFTAAVGPIPGDIRADNDRRGASIEVVDDRAKVLLIDGEARWEFQYLRNALARDPHVTVDAVVFRQPTFPGGDPTYLRALPPKPEPTAKGPQPDPLGAYDLIVLGDIRPGDLAADAWSRLERYVDSRGGTLAIASGPRSLAMMASGETSRKLLPVLAPRPVPPGSLKPDPTRPALPPGVAIAPASPSIEAFPMMRLDADPEQSRRVWSGLPPLPWVATGKAKPLATVLATAGTDAESSAALVAQPYGLGKVLWIGTDGTWRWRYRAGDRHHHRFWGQVVRWASGAKLAAGNRIVRFGPDRPRPIEGDATSIRAQFADDAPGVTPELLVAARVFKKGPDGKPSGDPVAVVPLRPRADAPRVFQAEAPPLARGAYLIRLDVPQMGAEAPSEAAAPLDVLPRDTPERVELAASRDPLDRLAATTGGRVFTIEDVAALPPLLKARTIERTRTEETSLWDRPGALVLFFALLAAEWALRKRAGLP